MCARWRCGLRWSHPSVAGPALLVDPLSKHLRISAAGTHHPWHWDVAGDSTGRTAIPTEQTAAYETDQGLQFNAEKNTGDRCH